MRRLAIATHFYYTNCPSFELRKWLLKDQSADFLWIAHPLMYHPRLQGRHFQVYAKGIQVGGMSSSVRKEATLVQYAKDFLLTVYWAVKSGLKYDVFIGFDNLNAFAGWVLKKLGVVNKCVFYVVDYSPLRFENRLLNWIYHKIESFCALHCDETWNLCERMVAARMTFKGIGRDQCGIQKIAPMGIWHDEMPRVAEGDIKYHQLVYMGAITKKQGVQFVIEAIPTILASVPDFSFLVIGDGDYLDELKAQADRLGVGEWVHFTGYVEDHHEIDRLVAESGLGVALYERGDPLRNFTYYTDPGKIKVYLGAGVPVLVTDVPHNAKEIEENRCGRIVTTEPASIAGAVVALMSDQDELKCYRRNALTYSLTFKWNDIFQRLLGGSAEEPFLDRQPNAGSVQNGIGNEESKAHDGM